MNIIFFIKSKCRGDNSVKQKKDEDSPLKGFVPDCTCANIDYFLLHGFDVCISIVRLDRYVVK